MITRLVGTLDSIEGTSATVTPHGGSGTSAGSGVSGGGGISYEVMLPAYFANRLSERIGQTITLHTREHLEAVGQGSSFVPRILGFPSIEEAKAFVESFSPWELFGAQVATVDPEVRPALDSATTETESTPDPPAEPVFSELLPTKEWWQFWKKS